MMPHQSAAAIDVWSAVSTSTSCPPNPDAFPIAPTQHHPLFFYDTTHYLLLSSHYFLILLFLHRLFRYILLKSTTTLRTMCLPVYSILSTSCAASHTLC